MLVTGSLMSCSKGFSLHWELVDGGVREGLAGNVASALSVANFGNVAKGAAIAGALLSPWPASFGTLSFAWVSIGRAHKRLLRFSGRYYLGATGDISVDGCTVTDNTILHPFAAIGAGLSVSNVAGLYLSSTLVKNNTVVAAIAAGVVGFRKNGFL